MGKQWKESTHAKSWLIGKDPDAGRDWGQEGKGVTEDEMAGWHHWLDGCSLSELRELVRDMEAWHAVIHGVAKSRTRLSDWTELIPHETADTDPTLYPSILCDIIMTMYFVHVSNTQYIIPIFALCDYFLEHFF